MDWQPLRQLVRRAQHLVISTHMRPDGDALGSALALRAGLETLGKSARVVLPSSLPPRYAHLAAAPDCVEFDAARAKELEPVDAIVIVDTGTWNQLGKFGDWMRRQDVPKLVIDHHRTQDDLGGERLVDVTAEACGRLIHEALAALEVPLTSEMATHLFIALAMDTGWFRHRNVSAETFRLAASLTDAGAMPNRLSEELYDRNSLARQRLTGWVLQTLEVMSGGRVCHSSITMADYMRVGAIPLDSEDLVNLTLSVAGVQVGVLFMEQPAGGTKVSLRSRGALDCSKLAESWGGGGHSAAAGAILDAPLPAARQTVLTAIQDALISG